MKLSNKILLSTAVSCMLLPVTSFALDASNVKFSGKTGVQADYYNSQEYVSGFIGLGAKGQISDNVSFNLSMVGADSLGFDRSVQGTKKSQTTIDVANVKVRGNKSVITIGRDKLDTPLAFSNTTKVLENSFDLVSVSMAFDNVPDTYFYGASIFRGNTTKDLTFKTLKGADGGSSPLYILGLYNKSLPNTTLQAWGYHRDKFADAIYLEGKTSITPDIDIKGQYAFADVEKSIGEDSKMFGIKAEYKYNDVWKIGFAYNKVDDGEVKVDFSDSDTSKSKLFTSTDTAGAITGFDLSALSDTDSFQISAEGQIPNTKDTLKASYTNIDNDNSYVIDSAHIYEFAYKTKLAKTGFDMNLTLGYMDFEKNTGGDDQESYASIKFVYNF